MSSRYPIPAGRHRAEIVVRRSRFIATADHTATVEDAKSLLADSRREFPDATHHVHAFAVGFGDSVIHGTSDDGEPAGTAGRPTLTVVQNSGLGDVCVVITRYFGGTKLGTGGLVKAYTGSCQKVLEELPRTEKVDRQGLEVTVPYGAYETFKRLCEQNEGVIESEDFGVDVRVMVSMGREQVDGFRVRLGEATSGVATVRPAED